MNDPAKNKPLLRDVLRDDQTGEFEEALLSQVLMLAKRRRRFRQARRAVLSLAVLAGVILVLARQWAPVGSPPVVMTPPLPKPYILVQTRPAPAGLIFQSRPLSPACVVVSAPTRQVIATAASAHHVRELSDDELLAMAHSPAMLVRHGPHLAELVFADPAAQEQLLRN
jgi:hypothetical protein